MRAVGGVFSRAVVGIGVLAAASSPHAAGAFESSLQVSFSVDVENGAYSVLVDGVPMLTSPRTGVQLCSRGTRGAAVLAGPLRNVSGTDKLGPWTGQTASYSRDGGKTVDVELTFQEYSGSLQAMGVATATFPNGLDTAGCGSNTELSTEFPSFNVTDGKASDLTAVSWCGGVIANVKAAKGLAALAVAGLDCGPVAATDPLTGSSLVWSTLNRHKIIPQATHDGAYRMGVSAAIPSIPAGYNHSVIFSAADGGITSAMYRWGERQQSFHGTTRLPSVTLTDIGYYTDDGAYYYVWGGGKEYNDPELSSWIPPRPWPAEEGLVLVKAALYNVGVPVAYMQLDDWWYQGKFFFGNVKAVTDWHASDSIGLFPNGLPAFSDRLDLPLQLYTPFFWDNYQTKYNMSESTSFKGTKVVVPNDAAGFFADLFDLGLNITNGRFSTYEIDFLDSNFKGCASCFEDVDAADRWYRGLGDAALARNITIQYCLPSATDMLVSLDFPAVVQARASGDYARPEGDMQPWANVADLGRASLLLGPLAMAPSKDTLWTSSPQPPTSSDRTKSGYHTQPHVALDAILATLSLGPVGISDCLGQTDVGLISQAFRSSTDSTLLRPSRPLSTVDAVFVNESLGLGAQDVRSTHAFITDGAPVSHYVVAWMSTVPVTLQRTDLFPRPSEGATLAVRQHVIAPAGAGAQMAGCIDGQPAAPGCIDVLEPGTMPVIDAVGANITNFSFTVIYEPFSNGAYFLGELQKFVHVSPQRFPSIVADTENSMPCGFNVSVIGSPTELIELVAVDPQGIVHVRTASVPEGASQVTVAF
eukprot:INCI5072.2.p1 GENE.INCI5072.2~~INCI5072.2.p1  ORF type:complete len:814 (-),score=111.60 INCI5072.2:2037-4478(-)